MINLHSKTWGNKSYPKPIQTLIPCVHTPSHTHTHTQRFPFFVGHSIGVMVFLLYKPYFLSSYTNPTPKPHRKLSAFLDFQYTPFCVIISLIPHGDLKNVPTRSKFTGIPIFVGIFGPHNVMNTRHTHTHTLSLSLSFSLYLTTHTHTHTHRFAHNSVHR